MTRPRKVFPEMVSVGDPEPATEFITNSIDSMLGDDYYLRSTLTDLDKLREQYAESGASAKAAGWICDSVGVTTRRALGNRSELRDLRRAA